MAKVHYVAFPKVNQIKCISESKDTDASLLSHLMLECSRFAKEKCPDGFRLMINNEMHGCQSVYHLHVHIVGGEQLSWDKLSSGN